jgi:hypothetical protein
MAVYTRVKAGCELIQSLTLQGNQILNVLGDKARTVQCFSSAPKYAYVP